MFGPALTRVHGASRIQARLLLDPSTRNARDVIAIAARGRHGRGSNGSRQSKSSSGRDQRHSGRLPLRPMAVAGVSMLAGAGTSDNSEESTRPFAFRDPSGWDYVEKNPAVMMDFIMRVHRAVDTNSIEEARSAQFNFTRSFLKLSVHGDVIDEGSLPSDIVFGAGRHVNKEDTRIFWVPSPELGKSSVMCLSVHYDLTGGERVEDLLVKALGAGLSKRLLEEFKEDESIYVNLHFSTGFVSFMIDRDTLVIGLEREKSMSSIQE